MQRYFLSKEDMMNQTITGDDAHHIKNVMRMTPGTKIILCDGVGHSFLGVIDTIVPEVTYTIERTLNENTELPFHVILGQGYPKMDKFEHIIQKCTELGVNEVIPVMMRRSIAKIDATKEEKKLKRWQKIAKEAAEQAHRLAIPNIHAAMTVDELIMIEADHRFLAYEMKTETTSLKEKIKHIKSNQKVLIVIGPEGGIDPSEASQFKAHGFELVHLGSRILRTETAGAHLMSILSFYAEGE